MAPMELTKPVVLSTAELDEHDFIRPAALLNLFQQIAGEHAEQLGIGFEALYARDLLWVISRLKAEIVASPALYEPLMLRTWPHPSGRVDFDRDYTLHGADGRLIARGTSKWCVINRVTRRLTRAAEIVFPGEFSLEKAFEAPLGKLDEAAAPAFLFDHTVRRSDLDHNVHMNNARYGDFLLNALPPDCSAQAFQIDFLHEAVLGDTVTVCATQSENAWQFIGRIGETPCFRAGMQAIAHKQ